VKDSWGHGGVWLKIKIQKLHLKLERLFGNINRPPTGLKNPFCRAVADVCIIVVLLLLLLYSICIFVFEPTLTYIYIEVSSSSQVYHIRALRVVRKPTRFEFITPNLLLSCVVKVFIVSTFNFFFGRRRTVLLF